MIHFQITDTQHEWANNRIYMDQWNTTACNNQEVKSLIVNLRAEVKSINPGEIYQKMVNNIKFNTRNYTKFVATNYLHY